MEDYEIAEFTDKKPEKKTAGVEMASSRELAEVQMAMFAAKQFPRDPIMAYDRIMTDCSRANLAKTAIYEFPRGGSTVTGPSIGLARALVRGWGNCESGIKVLESTATESTVMAYCWDLETNYREVKVFTVKHVRETKRGNYPLTDSRDIYELVANQGARRERSCILSVIPTDIVDAAVARCQKTLTDSDPMPLKDKVRAIVTSFQSQFGISQAQLEAQTGFKTTAWTQQTVLKLKGTYNSLRDGSASPEQYFDVSMTAPTPAKAEKKEVKLSEL